MTAARDDTERELRRRIVDSPDDDELRLVYADFLEERGDLDRAELIQIQVGLARLEPGDPRSYALRFEESAALARVPTDPELGYRRGLIGELRMSATELVERGAALMAEHPIEALHLAPAPTPAWIEVGAMPGLTAVRALSVDEPTFEQLDAVLGSPHLGSLSALSLQRVDDWCARRLVELGRFDRLARLAITDSNLADAGPELARSELANLRILSFADSDIDPQSAEDAAARSGLQALDLARTQLHEVALEPAPELRRLDVSAVPFFEDLPEALCKTGGLAELRIDSCIVGPRSLERFIAERDLDSLTGFGLGDNQLTVHAVAALRNAGILERLVELDLQSNPIGDAGIAELATVGSSRLQVLNLAGTLLSDRGFAALLDSAVFAELVALDIGHSLITDATAARLLDVKAPELRTIGGLEDTAISPALRSRLAERYRLVVGQLQR